MYKIVKYVLEATNNVPGDKRKEKALALAEMVKLTEHQKKQLIKAIEHEKAQQENTVTAKV